MLVLAVDEETGQPLLHVDETFPRRVPPGFQVYQVSTGTMSHNVTQCHTAAWTLTVNK